MPIITIVILVHSRQDKTRQGKEDNRRQDEVYIDSLHIMKMTVTMTMIMTMTIRTTMTIIIQ